jgi:hypothetical protein
VEGNGRDGDADGAGSDGDGSGGRMTRQIAVVLYILGGQVVPSRRRTGIHCCRWWRQGGGGDKRRGSFYQSGNKYAGAVISTRCATTLRRRRNRRCNSRATAHTTKRDGAEERESMYMREWRRIGHPLICDTKKRSKFGVPAGIALGCAALPANFDGVCGRTYTFL